jgi:hypothetical protein
MLFTKGLKKNMGKVSINNELRENLREKFRQHRGAHAAFCRERNISGTWLTWVLQGRYEAPELLLAAAEWLPEYIQRKHDDASRLEEAIAEQLAILN